MSEAEGLEAIFMANRPALTRYLRARLRGDGDCEDLVQELWVKLSVLHAEPIAAPLAYLYRMAENLALDKRRSALRRTRREMDWTSSQVDGIGSMAVDDQPSAERVMIARDHLKRVDQAIDALPERTGFAFRAVRVDGTPQKQVAANMGISLSAVEKHLQKGYRAIVDLQRAIDAETSDRERLTIEGSEDGNG